MMLLVTAIVLFVVLMGSISFYGYRLYSKSGRFYERLGEQKAAGDPTIFTGPVVPEKKWLVKVVEQIGEKVPISPQDASSARRYLIAAGYRSDTAIKVFYGVKIILGVVAFLLAVSLKNSVTSNPVMGIVFLVALTAGGFFSGNLLLERLISKRHFRIRMSLPDALDLMVVCMEAGLGLDQAILNVSRELKLTHKDICEELGMVTLEMRAGKRRGEALRNLADRTGEEELRKLVGTLIQADRFGTSLAEALRTHSDFLRVRRRQDAEERAAKVGVKLVFPIFFFLLPSMLVVAVGPGILQLMKVLFPLMKGAGV